MALHIAGLRFLLPLIAGLTVASMIKCAWSAEQGRRVGIPSQGRWANQDLQIEGNGERLCIGGSVTVLRGSGFEQSGLFEV
jgi:hypothetical protein